MGRSYIASLIFGGQLLGHPGQQLDGTVQSSTTNHLRQGQPVLLLGVGLFHSVVGYQDHVVSPSVQWRCRAVPLLPKGRAASPVLAFGLLCEKIQVSWQQNWSMEHLSLSAWPVSVCRQASTCRFRIATAVPPALCGGLFRPQAGGSSSEGCSTCRHHPCHQICCPLTAVHTACGYLPRSTS
jgi:hypothetical protein